MTSEEGPKGPVPVGEEAGFSSEIEETAYELAIITEFESHLERGLSADERALVQGRIRLWLSQLVEDALPTIDQAQQFIHTVKVELARVEPPIHTHDPN